MIITNEMFQVHNQSIQEKFVRISLLQSFFVAENTHQVRRFRKVGEVQGVAKGGSIDIDTTSAARRTCNIELHVLDSTFIIDEDRKIWMDKLFRVEIGLKNFITDEIVWFNKGIFAINNPSLRYDSISKNLTIQGLDLMSTLDGTLGGTLQSLTQIPNTFTVAQAIRTTATSLGKISVSNYYVEDNNAQIPYDIEKNAGDTVYSLLEELKNLFMDWEVYFDSEGRLIYQKIRNRYVVNPTPNQDNDLILFSFLSDNKFIINYSLDYQFSNVKNKIIVYGRTLDNGIQIMSTLENTDANSKFNINKPIGVIPHVFSDDKIFTTEQAEQRARFEFWKHNNLNEQLNIDMLPLYYLDGNRMIDFDIPDIELKGRYLIDRISFPLSHQGNMTLSAHKIYQAGS